MSSSQYCVAQLCALSEDWAEEAWQDALAGRNGSSAVFDFCRTMLPATVRLKLLRLSQSTIPYIFDPFKLQHIRHGTVLLRDDFGWSKKFTPEQGGKEAEQDLDRNSRTNMDDKLDKRDERERKNEGSIIGSTDSAEAPDQKISTSRDELIVGSLTSFGVSTGMATIVNNCEISWM